MLMTRSSPSQTKLPLHKPQPFSFTTLSPASPSQISALHNPQPSFSFTTPASPSQASTLLLHNPQPNFSFTNLSPSPSQANDKILSFTNFSAKSSLTNFSSQKILHKLVSPKVPRQTSQPKNSLMNFSAPEFINKLLSTKVPWKTYLLPSQLFSTKQSLLQPNDMVDGGPWQHGRFCWLWCKKFLDQKNKDKEKPQPTSQFLQQGKESTSLMTQWKDEDNNVEDVDNWIKKFLDLHNFLYKANLHLWPCQFLNSWTSW